jgi:hypothetical protein
MGAKSKDLWRWSMAEPMTELERLEYHDVIKRRHRLTVEKIKARREFEQTRSRIDKGNDTMLTIVSGVLLAGFMIWMSQVLYVCQ